MNLPIDVVPNTRPRRFKWRQLVDSMVGPRWVDSESALPAHVEAPVAALVELAKQQQDEIESLKHDNEGLQGQLIAAMDRVAAQNELLSKKAESPAKRGK